MNTCLALQFLLENTGFFWFYGASLAVDFLYRFNRKYVARNYFTQAYAFARKNLLTSSRHFYETTANDVVTIERPNTTGTTMDQ
jgi:hypothetical protein